MFKKKITAVIVLTFWSVLTVGQVRTKLVLPTVKENNIIDSLISSFWVKNHVNIDGRDSSLLMTIKNNTNGSAFYSIALIDSINISNKVLYIRENDFLKIGNVRCFIYRHNYIFIAGDSEPDGLFTPSKERIYFTVERCNLNPSYHLTMKEMLVYLYEYNKRERKFYTFPKLKN